MKGDSYFRRHPLQANMLIIFVVALLGLLIAFLWLNIFTRHGEREQVPGVENMSYTQAIKTLHDHGFRTDIRDSVYNEEINPGFVIEQFPAAGSYVKPGRKIFLYINAVHPREMVIDADNTMAGFALKGYSLRQGLAKLEELGFHKINIVRVPGDNDRIIKLTANGKTIMKMQKVPVNSLVTVEVYDGRSYEATDSIMEEEYLQYAAETRDATGETDKPEVESSSAVTGDDEDFLYDAEPEFVQ